MKYKRLFYLFIIYLCCAFLFGCSSPYRISYTVLWPYYYLNPSTKNHTEISRKPLSHSFKLQSDSSYIRVMFCGDIMVRNSDKILTFDENIKEILSNADLIIANCEAPVSKERDIKEGRKYYFKFLMPDEYLEEITKQVENRWMLSIANNHIADYGIDGFNGTLNAINEIDLSGRYNVSLVGRKDKNVQWPVLICNVENVRLGIVAWTQWLNKDNVFQSDQGIYRHDDVFNSEGQSRTNWQQIKEEENINTIIAYPHWEYEFQHFPVKDSVDQAKTLMSSGIDLIVGSHPHVLQAMDWCEGKICLYSLGNFCGLGGRWPTKLTAILEVKVSKELNNLGEVIGYELYPVVQVDKDDTLVLLQSGQKKHDSLKRKLKKRLKLMYDF